MTGQARSTPRPVVLLRPVPGDSAMRRLWAGTKLIVVFGISVLLTFYPGWSTIGAVALLVFGAARIARIPRGALPSVPRWLWVLLLIGGVTAAMSGGDPAGLGGLLFFLRITALSIVLLGLGAMVSWTTNVAEIAPAVATLGRPLRLLRIPVDEWAVALALGVPAFPVLGHRFRVLFAARRLRAQPTPRTRRQRRRLWAREAIDLITAAITVTLRRADEMGDAITARGGIGQISASPARPGLSDFVTLVVVVVMCGAAVALELTVLTVS